MKIMAKIMKKSKYIVRNLPLEFLLTISREIFCPFFNKKERRNFHILNKHRSIILKKSNILRWLFIYQKKKREIDSKDKISCRNFKAKKTFDKKVNATKNLRGDINLFSLLELNKST